MYGPRKERELGRMALDLGEEVMLRRQLSTGRHPDGMYL